jgi:hypothetical protein
MAVGSTRNSRGIVFLAAPFTGLVDVGQSIIPKEDPTRLRISRILSALRDADFQVLSSHERENWGRNLYTPERALNDDIVWLDRADLLVADIGDPPSPGVQFEIGYFVALHKPVLISTAYSLHLPYLARGLRDNHNVSYLPEGTKVTDIDPIVQWCVGKVRERRE